MFRKQLLATASVLAACGIQALPGVASAQTAPAGDGLQVQEIVVTARKREERLQDVPISANVTTGAALEKQDVKSLSELNSYVPNLFIQKTPANEAIYIRGIGSPAGNLAFEQSVGLFVDGVYAGRARQFAAPFLDVERVEVLRGPQGALFGKNTSAGAVNIVSRGPSSTFESISTLTATVAGQSGWEATQILSGPLTDTVSGRVALKISENEGWLKNTVNLRDEPRAYNLVGRAVLEWRPNDQLNVRLKLDGARQELTGQPMTTVAPGGSLKFERETTLGVPDYDNTNSFNTVLTATYDFASGHTLTSITGYSQFDYSKVIDSDFTSRSLLTSSFIEAFEQTSQELRLASPTDGRFTYIVGAYYHDNTTDIDQSTGITFGPFNGSQNRDFSQSNKTVSLYAQGVYAVTDKLRATVGLRQTWDDKSADQTRDKTGVLPPTWLATSLTGSRDEQAFDPSAQLQYSFSGDAMVYVSYARGSKAGGFVAAQSTTTPTQFQFDGESARSVEVGTKLMLLDRRVRLNAAIFETEYSDLQVSVFNAQSNSFITGNAASATSRGVELELAARLTPSLDLSSAASWLDAKYDDFPGAGCIYPLPPTPAGQTCTQNIGGTRIPRAPEWTFTGALNLNHPISGDLRLVGSLSATYRSEAFLEDSLSPASLQKAYTKIDARIGLADAEDRWEVAVVGKNLTDELTASHAFGTPFIAGSETFVVDLPRVIALQARLRY